MSLTNLRYFDNAVFGQLMLMVESWLNKNVDYHFMVSNAEDGVLSFNSFLCLSGLVLVFCVKESEIFI